jgi:hypothetical protein
MNPHSKENPYPSDAAMLSTLNPDTRAEFEQYIAALDAESAARGNPYGDGSLWTTTGVECWLPFFEDGYSPANAIEEDLSND